MIISNKKQQLQNRKKQAGITLVEVSIGLIIAAVLAAAAYLAFENNNRRNEVKSNVNTLTELGAELKTKFGRTNRYGDVTTAVAIQSATIPPELRDPGAVTAANIYGGAITVLPTQVQTADDAIQVVWDNVPSEQCSDIVVGVEPAVREVFVNAPGTGGVARGGAVSAIKDESGPVVELDVAALTTACEAQAAAGQVEITFVYGRN